MPRIVNSNQTEIGVQWCSLNANSELELWLVPNQTEDQIQDQYSNY